MRSPSPVDKLSPVLADLRAALQEAEYRQDTLRQLLQVQYPDDIGAINHTPAILRLDGDRSPRAIALRLFFLEANESPTHVRRLLGRAGAQRWEDLGLLETGTEGVRARLRIDPVNEHLLLGDRRFRRFDRRAMGLRGGDPVYPPSADSLMLREAVSALSRGDVLDLCTGSGVQAVSRAAEADHVVGVDINPRAVAMARINARLNDAANVEMVEGDLYAPLTSRRFATIVANPPFVTSPYSTAPSYHAGGPTGDEVLQRIIDGWNDHLEPRGRAFAITHVGIRQGETLERVARRWMRGFRGRALVCQLESGSPVDLAAAQAQFALERGTNAYAGEVRRWVDFLRRHRIEQVVAVIVAAERGAGKSVEVIDAQPRVLPLPLSTPAHQRIADWLALR